jgi:hypothetical protein
MQILILVKHQLLHPVKKYDGLTASWIEVVAGVKAKVFNNVFWALVFD